ncbi:hypothetical protein [Nannocystis pusilla]|uniref:hypothetical protein n=1 Tax=Nannocystis pusilla TaxID=889268 RepID=UPI003B767A70
MRAVVAGRFDGLDRREHLRELGRHDELGHEFGRSTHDRRRDGDDRPGPDGEATGTTSSTGDATTAVGECVVDPAQGLCSEGCDAIEDCCKCNRPTPLPTDVGGCAIPSGIVATLCPWSIDEVRLDGEPLAEGESECGEPPGMWVQYEQNGDRIVELCGEACATYLSGSFAELVMEVAFCEAA